MVTGSLEQILTEGLEAGVPGLCAVVVDSNGLIDAKAIGVRRAGESKPITIDDRFHLGSNTKAMVAVLAARLIEDGLLDWETSIAEVFTDLGEEILEPYRQVTFEMLLGHLGGVPPYTHDEDPGFVLPDAGETPGDLDVATFARWVICNRPPQLDPGSTFSYSNAGYSIVSAMLEAIVGETWSRLLRVQVFEPLLIGGAIGESWPARFDSAQPWGHIYGGATAVPHPPDGDYQLEAFLAPAGDVSMSMPDYGRFLRANLAGLSGTETVVPFETIRRLHNNGGIGPGLGWGITRLRSLERFGVFSTHAGSAGTFVTAAAISHEHDRAFALALNAGIADQYGDWLKAIIEMHLDN